MNLLEIKVDKIVNNSKGYGRMAVPVLHIWQWKQIALSKSNEALKVYAEKLSLDIFYLRKREYQITKLGVAA